MPQRTPKQKPYRGAPFENNHPEAPTNPKSLFRTVLKKKWRWTIITHQKSSCKRKTNNKLPWQEIWPNPAAKSRPFPRRGLRKKKKIFSPTLVARKKISIYNRKLQEETVFKISPHALCFSL